MQRMPTEKRQKGATDETFYSISLVARPMPFNCVNMSAQKDLISEEKTGILK
jgi:hypothetical protein